jgi:hypothetical protein
VRDRFRGLRLGKPIIHRPIQVERDLRHLTRREECAHGDETAVAGGEIGAYPQEDRGRLDAEAGRIALGWLVVQDIIVILALVLVPVAARGDASLSELLMAFGQKALQIAGFVAAVVVVGRRAIPWLLGKVADTGSRELFTLAVVVAALGIAYGSASLIRRLACARRILCRSGARRN